MAKLALTDRLPTTFVTTNIRANISRAVSTPSANTLSLSTSRNSPYAIRANLPTKKETPKC